MKKIAIILFVCVGCSSPKTYPEELMEPWGMCDIGDASNYTAAKIELIMRQHREQYRYYVGKDVDFVGKIANLVKYGEDSDIDYVLYLRHPNWSFPFDEFKNAPYVKVDISKKMYDAITYYDIGTIMRVEGEYLEICAVGIVYFETFIVAKEVSLYNDCKGSCPLPKK